MTQVKLPRWRYVAVRFEGPARSRGDLQAALAAAARKGGWPAGTEPHVTRFAWPHAIVRVPRSQGRAARSLLEAMGSQGDGWSTRTLSTSGTLRALTERLGILHERAPRPEGGTRDGQRNRGAGSRPSEAPSGGPRQAPATGPPAARSTPSDARSAAKPGGGPVRPPGR